MEASSVNLRSLKDWLKNATPSDFKVQNFIYLEKFYIFGKILNQILNL